MHILGYFERINKRMKIKLNQIQIANNTSNEVDLLDLPIIESMYQIRKLKAAVLEADKIIETDDVSPENDQVYIDKYLIWFNKDEYTCIDV